MYITNEKSKR